MAKKKIQVQGAQIPGENTQFGVSSRQVQPSALNATPKLGFLRSHQRCFY
jgi:hypothetical protein